jgi:hypothetical protein
MRSMAKLIVSTLPDRNAIAAFVANSEGVPTVGLGVANFKVRATAPGADGSLLTVAGVAPSNLRGFYVLDLATVSSPPRRTGLYVFDLLVECGEDRGQALSSAIIT